MKFLSKITLLSLLPAAASAQGLYSIAPNDDEASESLPLTYTVGVAAGYDDNPNPLYGDEEEAVYGSAYVQADWTSVTPQTTWEVFARLGVRHYFENFDNPVVGNDAEETSFNARLGVNFTKRFSERLRFATRNLFAYETEPDYSYGFGNSTRSGNYFRYSSQNSVGYRWSERFGTQTGIDFSGIRYDDLDNSDYDQIQFRQTGRYRVSPTTVLTGEYRYAVTDADISGDSDSHYLLGGVEHRFSPVSAIVLRAGAQFTDPDNGDERTLPYVEGAIRSQLTEQLGIRTFVRYSQEDYNRTVSSLGGRGVFGESDTLRVGVNLNYAVNPNLSLFGGVNYIMTDYNDLVSGTPGFNDGSEDLVNLNAGMSYEFVDGFFVTSSYNFTDNSSDFAGREYDRNRFELGLQTTF
jgi:hypothetical protein